ncbi:hypothetical protein DFH09DRAFT_1076512 [Mycena vulgaris]|nr:hypothetical protein DFH09DRAFT_1076512 [Mycena vulgaris]
MTSVTRSPSPSYALHFSLDASQRPDGIDFSPSPPEFRVEVAKKYGPYHSDPACTSVTSKKVAIQIGHGVGDSESSGLVLCVKHTGSKADRVLTVPNVLQHIHATLWSGPHITKLGEPDDIRMDTHRLSIDGESPEVGSRRVRLLQNSRTVFAGLSIDEINKTQIIDDDGDILEVDTWRGRAASPVLGLDELIGWRWEAEGSAAAGRCRRTLGQSPQLRKIAKGRTWQPPRSASGGTISRREKQRSSIAPRLRDPVFSRDADSTVVEDRMAVCEICIGRQRKDESILRCAPGYNYNAQEANVPTIAYSNGQGLIGSTVFAPWRAVVSGLVPKQQRATLHHLDHTYVPRRPTTERVGPGGWAQGLIYRGLHGASDIHVRLKLEEAWGESTLARVVVKSERDGSGEGGERNRVTPACSGDGIKSLPKFNLASVSLGLSISFPAFDTARAISVEQDRIPSGSMGASAKY